ncbi:MAG: single-stranded-DNA-specific exonuclease RecJ, partial [bacterium]
MPKKWNILPSPPAIFLNSHPELPPSITRLLWNRNLRTQEQIDEFLNPDYFQDLHDPFLFKDMPKALDIIFKAIEDQKNIVVHGDYDADGVCAAAILITALKKFGAKNTSVFIPHREIDGYGLNAKTVELFKDQNIGLIITCDCGVSNVAEIKMAKEFGMQVIVTDHHSIPATTPPADAIIHSKMPDETYPDKNICGAATAFKLVQALLKKHKETNEFLPDGQIHEAFEKWMLDLVAIATIGDMVPLLGESRTLARYGITVLNKTKNLGLQRLLIAANIADETGKPRRGQYNAFTVGFQIVPRLNAAGRMDHANTAFALLVSEDEEEAAKLAEQLCKNNTDRQKMTEKMVDEAVKQIEETKQEDNPFLFVLGEDWGMGILGLIAGRLKDKYYKPVMAMGRDEDEIFGSGRSILEFNLIRAMQSVPKMFEKFGGHPQA